MPDTRMIGSSTQPTSPVINITPPEPPKSPQAAPKPDKGKRIADDYEDSPRKLVKASTVVSPDPNEPVRVPFEINGKLYHLTNKEIQAYYELEERNQKVPEEAKLEEMTGIN
uniref:Uncharacterized protein n=1 Tax=Tanacetum cinerariifolium TaxID=118510 RepID=A0A699GSL8_TANCI|nr:hypothetical protein [Tanacetum cinerariifolium]